MIRYCLFFISLFLCCSISSQAKKLTRLEGTITNSSSNEVTILFYDNFIDFKPKEFRILLDYQGHFALELFLDVPKTVYFEHGFKEFMLYLKPGDDLKMIYDTGRKENVPEFIGKGAESNNFLMDFEKQFSKQTAASVRNNMLYLDAVSFRAYMDSEKEDRLNFFNSKGRNLSVEFKDFTRAEILFRWANALLQYRWEHPPAVGQHVPLSLNPAYYDFLDDLPINIPGFLQSEKFAYFINDYLDLLEEFGQELPDMHPLYGRAPGLFTGKVLEFAKATILYKAIKRNSLGWFEEELMDFLNTSKVARYKEAVAAAYDASLLLKTGDLAPEFSMYDLEGRLVRLSDFRGKVVYLDFWATWCPPCLEEMSYSAGLQRQFSRDQVVFLFISMDRDKNTWKKFVRERKLSGTHLFAPDIYDSKVAKAYSIKGLPSYFLIDSFGRIGRVPAPRPSNREAYSQIKDLIPEVIGQ